MTTDSWLTFRNHQEGPGLRGLSFLSLLIIDVCLAPQAVLPPLSSRSIGEEQACLNGLRLQMQSFTNRHSDVTGECGDDLLARVKLHGGDRLVSEAFHQSPQQRKSLCPAPQTDKRSEKSDQPTNSANQDGLIAALADSVSMGIQLTLKCGRTRPQRAGIKARGSHCLIASRCAASGQRRISSALWRQNARPRRTGA